MTTVWILVMAFLRADGSIGVGFGIQPGSANAIEYVSEQACLDASRDALEHQPRYVVHAQAMCAKMEKPQ